MHTSWGRWIALIAVMAIGPEVLAEEPSVGVGPTAVSFRKLRLSNSFYAEGAAYADVNNDGHNDVLAGPFWWAGPDYQVRREIYEPKAFSPKGYSQNFSMFAQDFNGDGWTDVLVIGFPGAASSWYENPGPEPKQGQRWKPHVATPVTDNESPTLRDITGDGRPELLFQTGTQYGYAQPNREDPGALWKFHPISDRNTAGGKFEHGMGVGDVNGDGRLDMLVHKGWLEQPKEDGIWPFHPYPFAQAASHMHVYDLDGDGDNDVVNAWHCHQWGVVWHEQSSSDDGVPKFERRWIVGKNPEDTPHGLTFTQSHALELIDIDGDGVKDIVTGKRYWAHGGHDPGGNDPAVLYWFRTVRTADGGVEFEPHRIDDDSGVGTQVTVGDINGDRAADILVGNKKGVFVFFQQR